MIQLKPMCSKYVDAEVAQYFVGLTHLEPIECLSYVIEQIIEQSDIEKNVYRAMHILWSMGYGRVDYLGSGIIRLMDDRFKMNRSEVIEYLGVVWDTLYEIESVHAVPGYGSDEIENVINEHRSAIFLIISYLKYIVDLEIQVD